MKIFFALCLLAAPAAAREFRFTKKVIPDRLQAELVQAGFSVDYISCSGEKLDRCVVVMPDAEKKDPGPIVQAHVYADPRAAFSARRAEAAALVKKMKDGTISAAEKDKLILLMAQMLSLGD